MRHQNIGNVFVYLLVLFVCLFSFAHLKLQGNYAYQGISPNPIILMSLVAAILFNTIRTFFISIATTIVYFVALNYQADHQLVDSIFTVEPLSVAFVILAFPIVISEFVGRNRKSIENLKTNIGNKEKLVETLKDEVDSTKEGLKTISKKYTEHSLSDIEILGFIQNSIEGKMDEWAKGIASFSTAYLDNCSIEIFYGDFYYSNEGKDCAVENRRKYNILLEVFNKTKSKSILTPLDPNWPQSFQHLSSAAFLIDFKGPQKGLLLASNIPFKSYLEQHLERISKLLSISAGYTIVSNEYQELRYNQATIGESPILGPVVYKNIVPKLKKMIGPQGKAVNQFRISINRELKQKDYIQDEILGVSWAALIGEDDLLFKMPESNEYHLMTISGSNTLHPLLDHIEKSKNQLKDPNFISFCRLDV